MDRSGAEGIDNFDAPNQRSARFGTANGSTDQFFGIVFRSDSGVVFQHQNMGYIARDFLFLDVDFEAYAIVMLWLIQTYTYLLFTVTQVILIFQ